MIERMCRGKVPVKHHTAARDEQGRLLYEECLTRDGFEGPYSTLYHQHRPHLLRPEGAVTRWPVATASATSPSLQRRAFQSSALSPLAQGPTVARVPLLFNGELVVSRVLPTTDDRDYFINADADELYFIHRGCATLHTAFGELTLDELDYVVIPKGIAHRFALGDARQQRWLHVECKRSIHLPRQWRNTLGQLRMDAPYCHRDFKVSTFVGYRDEAIRTVVIKRNDLFFAFVSEHTPFDVLGWDGTVYPFALPILNFQPRVGMVHLPPSWHGTFATPGALICSFVPRPVDFHPQAIPCPYPHSSVDMDEVIFYCRGNFTSRNGIHEEAVSLHPAGVAHGPHAGAYERSMGSTYTDEVAVMIDCYSPLQACAAAQTCEISDYHASFGDVHLF